MIKPHCYRPRIFRHCDMVDPTLIIPVTSKLFLVWFGDKKQRDEEWNLKNADYVSSMRRSFPTETIFEICTKSTVLTEISFEEAAQMTGTSVEKIEQMAEGYFITLLYQELNDREW